MGHPFRKIFTLSQTQQNQTIKAWFPAYDAVPPYLSTDRQIAIRGFVTGVSGRRGAANFTTTSVVIEVTDDLTADPASPTVGRRVHKSTAYVNPASSATEPFHDVRFDPEYFNQGFWVVITIASSAGAGTDTWLVTVQGEIDEPAG